MIKFTEYALTFQEVPDEANLVICISNCPHRCPGCHSPYLQQDFGDELTIPFLSDLLDKHADEITCVCLMGEGNDPKALYKVLKFIRSKGFKTCLYSGSDMIDVFLLPVLSYLKLGPYDARLGGLSSRTTNQRFYIVNSGETQSVLTDITYKFWKD